MALLDSVKTLFGVSSPFTLQSVPGFPYSDWLGQQERYADFENWYSGQALNEKIQDKAGNLVDKFPLKLNPIRNTCEKHATVLLGNTLESIRHGGVPITFVPDGKDAGAAEVVNDALINSFLGGGGGSLFVTNATLSQYLGGCIFGVSWHPENEKYPVQTFAPLPTEFIGYPEGNNFWTLREAWFVREISWMDAEAYGYPVPEIVKDSQMPSDVRNNGYNYYYMEHWTKDQYSVKVNDMTINLDGFALEGKNPFGLVPFVYIPHMRGKYFLGESLITETVKGIIREMNMRNADIGDAVFTDTHAVLAIRGVRGSLKAAKLPDGRTVVDLGSAAGMGSNETQPDMISVKTQSAAEPQLKFVEQLDQLYRIETRHPAVADGLDEGSQRSSLTLTTRMWPLQSHVELERIYWTTGLLKLAEIILTMCAVKGAYKVTMKDKDISLIIKWATMLPRDREELVNEIAIRKKNSLISIQHAISLFGDVDNIDEEIKNIDEDSEKATEQALKLKPPPGQDMGMGGDGPKSKDPHASNQMKKEE